MEKLIGFIHSFKDLNWKEIVFRELNLLPFLVGALLLVLFLKFLIKAKSKRRIGLGVSSLAFFKKRKIFWKSLPEFLFVIAVLVLVFALLKPVFPLIKNKKNIKAKEIMLVLDCSNSMITFPGAYWSGQGYIGPQNGSLLKIHIAINYLIKLIKMRRNDALGLIVYSDNAYLISPLNYQDHQSLISLIKLFGADITPESDNIIPNEGSTATGEALFLANDYLREYGQNKERIIVLLTDGECNWGRDPKSAFEEIKKTGFRVFVLGIDYYQYVSAEEIAQGAKESKGDFFPVDTEKKLERAINRIDRLVGDNTMTVDEYIVDKPQYFYFGFIALILFFLALFLKHLHYFRDLL